jgi:hypothetical protein
LARPCLCTGLRTNGDSSPIPHWQTLAREKLRLQDAIIE